jgi:hypothetical protein
LERASEYGEREPWEGEGKESLRETKRELWEKETPLETDFDVSFGKCLVGLGYAKVRQEGRCFKCFFVFCLQPANAKLEENLN